MIPNFKLIFNNKYQSLLGNEYLINNLYQLTGKFEFNVKCLELYKITIKYF